MDSDNFDDAVRFRGVVHELIVSVTGSRDDEYFVLVDARPTGSALLSKSEARELWEMLGRVLGESDTFGDDDAFS